MIDFTSDIDAAPPVLRFAPSPNGYLHLGHAYSALFNQRIARAAGGRFLLRIEDIDPQRSRPAFEQAIYEDLAWLGITWEDPVRRQSENLHDYAMALDKLAAKGLVYPCFCTRADIAAAAAARAASRDSWPRDPDGSPFYPGTCKNLSDQDRERRVASGRFAAMRLDMQAALALGQDLIGWREYFEGDEPRDVNAEPSLWGDPIIARKDVPTSYHLAVVVDDALQGVTDVARGMDLFNATSLHRLLQTLLDLPAPHYRHHRLIEDEVGRKLSKSEQSPTLRALRAQGVSAQEVRRSLGFD